MNNEYVIINKSLIEKRIEELEKERVLHETVNIGMFDPIWAAKTSQAIDLLREILSQSCPLLPEIDKAYWAGMQFVGEDKGSPTEYISNLKLDI